MITSEYQQKQRLLYQQRDFDCLQFLAANVDSSVIDVAAGLGLHRRGDSVRYSAGYKTTKNRIYKFVAMGWAESIRNPDNGRVRRVNLTRAGFRQLAKMRDE